MALMDVNMGNTGTKRGREEESGKAKGKGKDKGKKQKVVDTNVLRTASVSGGQKLCGAFNSRKGCPNERSCPQRAQHACSVIQPDGTVCLRRDHGATGHEQATRQYSSIWAGNR